MFIQLQNVYRAMAGTCLKATPSPWRAPCARAAGVNCIASRAPAPSRPAAIVVPPLAAQVTCAVENWSAKKVLHEKNI